MHILRVFLAKCRALFRRNVVADEIREEMQFHVDMRAEELRARGVAPEAATRAASRRFGNLAVMQDRGYDERGAGVLESIVQDLRFTGRLLRLQKAFALVAVLTLGLAIGASTALFSIIDVALLRPLPYRELDRIVEVQVIERDEAGQPPFGKAPSFDDLEAWRPSSRVFSLLAQGREGAGPATVDAGQPERVSVGAAAPGFFGIFGGSPFLGRDFSVEDTRGGIATAAILSHDFWQSRFGGDRSALGRTIRVDRDTLTIVGILPPGFKPNYFGDAAVWRPILRPNAVMAPMRGIGITAFGKLRPGIELDQASREVTDLARRIAAANGHSTNFDVEVQSHYDQTVSRSHGTIRVLVGAVVGILLIACINVAGLLLARGSTRQSELAIRASLGAGRPRLVRQLLTESLVLGIAGTVFGVGLAWLVLDVIVAIVPLRLPANVPAAVNLQVLAFAAGLSFVTAMTFGLLPAVRLSQVQLGSRIAQASRRMGPALSLRGGQMLIAAEVALAIVLLTGAGLLVKSFAKAVSIDVGFQPDTFMTMEVFPVDERPAARREYFERLVEAVRAIPGVSAAGTVDVLPLADGGHYTDAEAGSVSVYASFKHTSAGYFDALGLTPIQGRLLTPADRPSAAVLSESAARRLYAGANALGGPFMANDRVHTVVGIVRDIRSHIDYREGFAPDPRPDIYVLLDDGFFGDRRARVPKVVVRSAIPAAGLADDLRRAAHGVGPAVIVERIRSGSDWFSDVVEEPRHRTLLIGSLGGLGLTLTLVGIFGVTAYTVTRRTQEVGVRMAFGARPDQVVRAMVGDAAWPTIAGIAVGLAGAYYGTRVIENFLYDTTPHDAMTFAVVALFMATTAIVAAWIPARRAALVDPVQALRAE